MKILLIEESETCSECLLGIYNKRWFCLKTGKDIDIISKSRYEKPLWCPLRPLPQKKSHKEYSWNAEKIETINDYENGWNDCIDEITGEKDESGISD